jgi:hypothetical protein
MQWRTPPQLDPRSLRSSGMSYPTQPYTAERSYYLAGPLTVPGALRHAPQPIPEEDLPGMRRAAANRRACLHVSCQQRLDLGFDSGKATRYSPTE